MDSTCMQGTDSTQVSLAVGERVALSKVPKSRRGQPGARTQEEQRHLHGVV